MLVNHDVRIHSRNPGIETAHVRMPNHVLDSASFEQTLQHDELAQIVRLCQMHETHELESPSFNDAERSKSEPFHCFFI